MKLLGKRRVFRLQFKSSTILYERKIKFPGDIESLNYGNGRKYPSIQINELQKMRYSF